MSAQFILPGRLTNPLAFTKLQIAKAYALSRSCNPRNIEFPLYGLWSQYLMDLTSDSRFLIVIPQHLLYYVPTEDSSDSDEGDSNVEDLADTSISTIDSRPSTKPERSAKEILPDFAIIRVICRFRNYVLRPTYLNLKIRYAGVPILVEVKRGGSRSLDGVDFLRSTSVEVERAMDDLYRQAAYMFTMHQRQKYVVLVACSGIYWSCTLIDRDNIMDRVAQQPTDDFQPDVDDLSGQIDSDDENDEGKDCGDVLLEDDIDELDLIGQSEGPAAQEANPEDESAEARSSSPISEEDLLEPVVTETDLVLPLNTWTGLLCLDTQASNQKMFLIHTRLRNVVRDDTGMMG